MLQKNEKYKSKIGGIATIVLIIIFGLLTIYKALLMNNKTQFEMS